MNVDLAVHRTYWPKPPSSSPLLLYMSLSVDYWTATAAAWANHSSIVCPPSSLPDWRWCDLIKRTRGETEGSGCSQRPRSALCWPDNMRWILFIRGPQKERWFKSFLTSLALPLSFSSFFFWTMERYHFILPWRGQVELCTVSVGSVTEWFGVER